MNKITNITSKTIIVSIVVVAVLLIAVTAVYGQHDIDIDDDSIDDWAGIPVFQTDPADASPPDEDIINTWVATGNDNYLYFLAEMNGSPALAGAKKGVAALIDCNNDGDGDDPIDRIVIFYPNHSTRRTTICQGTGIQCSFVEYGGKRVGSHLEWRVDRDDNLPPDPINPEPANCQGEIGIRFGVLDANNSPPTTLDEIEDFRGYNIPNAITMQAFEAHTDSGLSVLIVTAAMLLLSVTLIIFRIRQTA